MSGMKKRTYLILILLGLCFWMAVSRLGRGYRTEGRQQLETWLHRTAVSCYALEGFYPPNLDYMKEHYGFDYDEQTYIIHYEAIASNLMPDITVMERLP